MSSLRQQLNFVNKHLNQDAFVVRVVNLNYYYIFITNLVLRVAAITPGKYFIPVRLSICVGCGKSKRGEQTFSGEIHGFEFYVFVLHLLRLHGVLLHYDLNTQKGSFFTLS